ncbi:putative flotillin domain-containing protein [Phaeomoniella chlamydospora]|uniref:Putative flotillin domain-containing protein n=1 Tax=Phaeomoniella chlamydospora TaxID=158046 RepID=A0A0G2HJN6_PHACM|nr:putative flotillin domain-containing protein [Phaeomoniella chlamydospora]
MWYFIAEPSEFLVVTGAGISDVRIVKKAFIKPWQRVTRISIIPFDFSLDLQAMSAEKISARIPAVFTIGPEPDNGEALKKYALLLSGSPGDNHPRRGPIQPTTGSHVQDIVKGIIEGETRVIVSGMTMEEIFRERQVFKQKVIDNVQSELNQFGLRIYNANVKELQDTPGSEYFAFLSRKAHEGASNQARIDVAEARMRGEIGEAEKNGRTKQEISKINAETAVLETKRKADKAQADAALSTRQTELDMGIKLANIKAQRQAEAKDAELRKEVEMKNAETELERLRASDVTKSKINREIAQQQADAEYYSRVKAVEGQTFQQRETAEADYFGQTKDAEAMYFRKLKEADAAFYAKQKEADGVAELARAYGALGEVLGGPQGLLQYLMLENNTYEKLALANAKAINGLQPKISCWSTGDGTSSDAMAPIRNLMQSLPPLLSTINEQTGIAPPNWLATMPQGQDLEAVAKQQEKMRVIQKKGLTHGRKDHEANNVDQVQ